MSGIPGVTYVGLTNVNNQGCLMKIIDYKDYNHITIEFQDEFKHQKETRVDVFYNGEIKNPYYPNVCSVGICGSKYPLRICGKRLKEYNTWCNILRRCFDEKYKNSRPTYKDVACCEEWLSYENFYEWLHSQENFDKWLNGDRWAVDKDILFKGNKIYSPETCCLVPIEINSLFTKNDINRGGLPIGVHKHYDKYAADYIYSKDKCKAKSTTFSYSTPEDAFYLGYKPSKEAYIKHIAQEEYDKGNITKRCYEAMINYEVEITD